MGRPIKESMDYFSHDTNARRDRKLKLLMHGAGAVGLGVYWSLLEDIYNNSYYLPWTADDQMLFASELDSERFPLSADDVGFVIRKACEVGLFSPEVLSRSNVLTSPSVQKRYLKQSIRRTVTEMREDWVLINIDEFYQKELSDSKLSVKIVDDGGDTVRILGDYVENGGNEGKDVPKNPSAGEDVDNSGGEEGGYEQKYDFSCEHSWDGEQPIDYAGCVDTWNQITGGRARVTESKRVDLRRVFRNYVGKECFDAMVVRAEDETMKNSKYLTDWSTLFGHKKLEKLDKWVGRGREWREDISQLSTPEDHLENGWKTQAQAQKISEATGVDFEDPMFWETKKVDSQLLYLPKFNY